MKTISYVYPFWVKSTANGWIGCKPSLIFYVMYLAISWGYKVWYLKKNPNTQDDTSLPQDWKEIFSQKKSVGTAFMYISILSLYFFQPLAGKDDVFPVGIAQNYLRYESFLSGGLVITVTFFLLCRFTWQHICFLDKVATAIILISIFSTIITRQVDSYWIANLVWFIILGLVCYLTTYWWKNFHPNMNTTVTRGSFRPMETYEQLFPQRKQLADDLVGIICSQNVAEPLSICIAGDWGVGKTSLINGTIDKLKREDPTKQYEYLYINAMEIDTLSSLFKYVFGRIRSILKKRRAYVGVGSEYRRFITSAVGQITDTSIATLMENHLLPSSDDYREQLKELESCISAALGDDKILIIVDDVERCDPDKAQQFIFFIKEIATIRNCITIFLANYEYLNQRYDLTAANNTDSPEKKNYSFYEKFFNYRIDVPLIILEEAMKNLEEDPQEKSMQLGFRTPSQLFAVMEERLKGLAQKYREDAENKQNGSQNDLAAQLERCCILFREQFSLPRMLIKFYKSIEAGCAELADHYLESGGLDEKSKEFFSLIRADEVLFLLSYVETYAPYVYRHLKEQGPGYLTSLDPDTDDTKSIIKELGDGLLYSKRRAFFESRDNEYRYSEARLFAEGYLSNDLPQKGEIFSSQNGKWFHAIQEGNEELMSSAWTAIVQATVEGFAWKKDTAQWEQGTELLKKLFSFAARQLSTSRWQIERAFSIFEKGQHNETAFSGHIAVMKIFWDELGNMLAGCSQKEVALLQEFSTRYLCLRVSPACSAANFLIPAEYSRDPVRARLIDAAQKYLVYNGDPIDNLNRFFDKICEAFSPIYIPSNEDIFQRFQALLSEEKKYTAGRNLDQYDDIKDRIQLLEISIEDMEYFVRILRKVREQAIPTKEFFSLADMSDIDKIIQQFRTALNSPNAKTDGSLRQNLNGLFQKIKNEDIELCDRQYAELHALITDGEKLYGDASFKRKILADHQENSQKGTASLESHEANREEESPGKTGSSTNPRQN